MLVEELRAVRNVRAALALYARRVIEAAFDYSLRILFQLITYVMQYAVTTRTCYIHRDFLRLSRPTRLSLYD